LPFARPFDPVATFRLGLERRFEMLAFLRVIESYVMVGRDCLRQLRPDWIEDRSWYYDIE
jgi:hypothetical protein